MIEIKYTQEFRSDLNNLLSDIPDLKEGVDLAASLFSKKPTDTRLELHPLKRRLKGKYAISVTEDIRIIFEWLDKRTVRFLAIGPHSKVYPGYKRSKV
jgi:addiction module RelE/StbE family toxin